MFRPLRAIAPSPLLRLALLSALLVSLVAVPGPGRVMGASLTLYVSPSGSDTPNACTSPLTACQTIGHALWLAPAGSTINIAPGTYAELLSIQRDVTLSGAGAGQTIIDGGQQGTVVSVVISTTAAISGVTIQHGNAMALPGGGGIYNGGTLTLSNSAVISNTAAYTVAGNSGGTGIVNTGVLTVANSVISGNIAPSGSVASGLSNHGGTMTVANSAVVSNTGGGIENTNGMPTLVLTNSTVSNNTQGASGAGIEGAGGTIAITNSTISGNSTVDQGQGGGIFFESPNPLTLTNSTVSGNTAAYGGGILVDSSPVTIRNSTISGNSASQQGGGIYDWSNSTSIANSILAANNAPQSTSGPDCYGPLTSPGYNILGTNAGCSGITNGVNGDQVGTASAPLDPLLGPLQDNGGSTWTMALLAGSPAIDAGNPTGCTDAQGNLLTTDQRGYPRPSPSGGRCDSGAYEYQSRSAVTATSTPVPPTATSSPTSTATATPTATSTASPTATNMPTRTPTVTPTSTPTATPTRSATPTATATPRPTNTPTAVPTSTPTQGHHKR